MTMRHALALAVLVLAACQPAPAAPASTSTGASAPGPASYPPRTDGTVAECGQRIDKSFVLASDLTCTGDALVVVADDVTVDLNGRLLKGPSMGPQTWPAPQLDSVGVRVDGRKNVTVRNGRITDFSTGVYFMKTVAGVIEDVESVRSRYGLYVHQSEKPTIRRNRVERNIYGLHLQETHDALIEENDLSRQTYNSPGGYGIYLYASRGNRIVRNTIDSNINWGIWSSESRGNVFFHNNVVGNRPQVADSSSENQWYDPVKKEGNWWGDHKAADADRDGIADLPYSILGAGTTIDPYPFMERDGWKRKTGATVDRFVPPAPRGRVDVRVVAISGGTVVGASPRDERARSLGVGASTIALANDGHTVYALDGRSLVALDARSGAAAPPLELTVDATRVAANRDGRNAFLIGAQGAEQIDVTSGRRSRFVYAGEPTAIAPSYKHNQMFVATYDGIDMLYVQTGQSGTAYSRGGHVPYTIPLGGAPVAMAMNGSGTRIYAMTSGSDVVQVVDTEQLVVVDRFSVEANAKALAVGPRESRLYVATDDGIVSVDLPARRVDARTPLPGRAVDLVVSPNGDELYVALDGARLGIAVVGAVDLRVLHIIDLFAPPSRLVVATI